MTMAVGVVLLSSYSLVLLGAAQALRALGRRSTSPWKSRTLAGYRRATGVEPEPMTDDDWPHSEVPRLYDGMALVAALAAGALCIGTLAVYPSQAAGALPLVVLALAAVSVWRMTRSR